MAVEIISAEIENKMIQPSNNPYAAPQTTDLELPNTDSPSEKVRKYCIATETSIKSTGALYIIFGVVSLVGNVSLGIAVSQNSFFAKFSTIELIILAFIGVVGCFGIVCGIALRRLTVFGRISGTVLSVLGLLAIPIGTIACTYFLYVLWSKQASTVLSLDYKKIIADTPHVRYGASLVANLVAAAVIITIIAACAFVL